MDPMTRAVLDYVANEYLDDEDEVELGPDTPLISSGIVDSFSMVSLKTFLERRYGVKLPDDEATPEAFDTVSSVVALVRKYGGK
jgi:acyl carrier protein